MIGIGEFSPSARSPGELDGRLDRFRPRIREEHLVEIGHAREQPLSEDASQRRHIHLHEIGKFGIEDALQRLTQCRVIAPDSEYAEAAQQIEIALPLAIIEILTSAATKADIVAYRAEDSHHLLVQMTNVHRIPVTFVLRE